MMGRRQGGFTLVEILVASAILALIGSMLFGSFNAVLASGIGAQERADSDQVARFIVRKMTEDLQSAALLSRNSGSHFMGVNAGGNGDRDRARDTLSLTGYGRRVVAHGLVADQAAIDWYIETREKDSGEEDLYILMRRENGRLTDFDGGKEAAELFDVTDRLVSFNLRYYRKGDFHDQHDSGRDGGLPIAVAVRFTLEDEAGARNNYGALIRVGGAS